MDSWLGLCELSLAVGAASFTVARAGIFAPVRDWTKRRSAWLGQLLSCPWCVSHWLALALVATTGSVTEPYGNPFADGAVSAFVLVAGAGLFTSAIEAMNRAWQPPPESAKKERKPSGAGKKEPEAGGHP